MRSFTACCAPVPSATTAMTAPTPITMPSIVSNVLGADGSGTGRPALHLHVEPLQHAQAELALALDGDDPGVRQLVAWRRP